MENRIIKTVCKGIQTEDGSGVKLKRMIPSPEIDILDPFLLLDEFGSYNPNDYIGGFPEHPHKGFETITYMLNGKFKHKDTLGNTGYLSDGSVQWMTAGKGIIHSEMPEQTDGLIRGFQLWLNLPQKKKLIEPSYNDISSEMIPVVQLLGFKVKVIAGTFSGITGPGNPHTPMLYYDITMESNKNISIPIDNRWNGLCYVYKGSLFCNKKLEKGDLGVLSNNGTFNCKSINQVCQFILIAGMPLNEPVARGGPFVMNTKEEVLQAFQDYQTGNLVKETLSNK